MRRRSVIAFAGWWVLAAVGPSYGDSWSAPTPQRVVSPSGKWSAAMTPGTLGHQTATIVVARTDSHGSSGGWRRPLVNVWAPLRAFVSDAREVVTLGDWGHEGYEHAVVIYDQAGKVVIDQPLEQFMTQDELAKTRRSVSSRWWRYESENPELEGELFSVTTSWGEALKFDLRTGRVSRGQGLFERFRRYCEGTRPAGEPFIDVSRLWRNGEDLLGWECQLRRTGVTCIRNDKPGGDFRSDAKIPVDPRQFEGLLKDAVAVAPYIGNDIPEFEKPVLNMHITFGDGAGRRADTYEIRYKPAEVTPAARAWTSRLETLVQAPR